MELSVRFFKRLILTALVLLIVVPIFLAVRFHQQYQRLQAEGLVLQDQLRKTQEQLNRALEKTAGSGDLLTTEDLPYQASYPELYCQPQQTRSWVKAENTVYLTFDDGPSSHTEQLLDILDDAGVKATFFVTGQNDGEENRARLQVISERGHTIGIHSYTHDYLNIYDSVENYLEDFDQAYHMIWEATGTAPELFRFPGGSINSYNSSNGISQQLIAEMLRRGFVFYDWNVTGADTARGANRESVTQAVLSGMEGKKRAIIVLHDTFDKPWTVEALPGILSELKARGYAFEPLTPAVLPMVFSYNARV